MRGKERPSADRLFVHVTFRDLRHCFRPLSSVLTPSPSSLVQSTSYLRFTLIAVISKDKERPAVAMAVCEIFYHCVLGMFSSFFLLLKRTWPHGFPISRSLDLRLPGSSNALIRLRHRIRLRLGLNFGETRISVTVLNQSIR